MTHPLLCARCGAALGAAAATGIVTCPFCGTTSAPAPRVVERIVERVVVVNVEGETADPNAVGCPRCAKAMEPVQGSGQTALACPRCAGGWVSDEQLAAFRVRRMEGLVKAIANVRPAFVRLEPRRARLSCPFCATELRMAEVEGSVYLMHHCATHGAFCENGALGEYDELHANRRAGELDEDDLVDMGIKPRGLFDFFRK